MHAELNRLDYILLPRLVCPEEATFGLCVTEALGVKLYVQTPEGEAPVTEAMLETWGLAPLEAAAIAVDNLATKADETRWLDIPAAPSIRALYAEDGDAATRILLLERLLALPWAGALVAVPDSGQLLILPLEHYESLDDLATLVLGTQLAAQAATHPLCTDLFYFDGTGWTTLHVEESFGETRLLPSPGLASALETLASHTLAPGVAEA